MWLDPVRSLGQLFSRQEDQRRLDSVIMVIVIIIIIIIIILVGCLPCVSAIAYTFNCFKLPPTNLTHLSLLISIARPP